MGLLFFEINIKLIGLFTSIRLHLCHISINDRITCEK